jgi:hypothetical protein
VPSENDNLPARKRRLCSALDVQDSRRGDVGAIPLDALDLFGDQQLAGGRLGSRGAALVPLHPASTGHLACLYTTERSTP